MSAKRNLRVALFGGGGFIGVNLARHLAELDGYDPVVYDKVDEKLQLRFDSFGACPFEPCDIARDLGVIDAAVVDADVVVNLVAHVLPKRFIGSPLDVVELNLHHSMNVVQACIRHSKRLMHFSTCEVYGKAGGSSEPFREDETDLTVGPVANHRWIYSNTKQLLDRIIHAHGMRGDLEYTIVRPFNFVGPLMDWLGTSEGGVPRVFASFMTSLLEDRPMALVGGGHSRRCFTYIGDAVRALSTILDNPDATRNQIINIGNPGNETTIRDLADLMRLIYRRHFDPAVSAPSVEVSGEEFYGPGYEDCDRRLPDISKMRAIGWEPRFSLRETFEASIAYAVENRDALAALA